MFLPRVSANDVKSEYMEAQEEGEANYVSCGTQGVSPEVATTSAKDDMQVGRHSQKHEGFKWDPEPPGNAHETHKIHGENHGR